MRPIEIITLCIGTTSAIVIPMLIWIVKITSKWTRLEATLAQVMEDLDKIVKDKDKTHEAMLQQMTDDRGATNLRLRWLEEHLWRTRRPPAA